MDFILCNILTVASFQSEIFAPGEIAALPSIHSLVTRISPTNSCVPETVTSVEQVTSTVDPDSSINHPQGLDEFTCKINADDARVLVDLLKLAVAVRAGDKGREALSEVLTVVGKSYSSVSYL